MSEKETNIEISKRDVSVADAFGYSDAQVAVIKNTVAKNTTVTELAYFLSVCKSLDLNPFNKEIWCYKDNKGNLIIFTGRDGMLAKAQKNPLFNGLRSCEVCEHDEIEIDIPNATIYHKINPKKARGKILGAYCFVFRKDGEPTVEWKELDVYNKGYNTWKTHPADMIKKVSEAHTLKKAFGISGIQVEYDFTVDDRGIASPINTRKPEIESRYDKMEIEPINE